MSQPHSLTWGDIRLAGDTIDPDADFVIEAMANGTKLGTAKALTEFVKSLQVDGSLAVMNGHDNAETVLQLRVSAPDGKPAGPAVAKAAGALAANASADPIPPLTWISPLEDAATCVYDVYAADPVRDEGEGWDLDEEMRECRYFTVTMSRHPFARPLNPVVVPTLPTPPPTPTTIVIDDCNSLTNWSAPAGTISLASSIISSSTTASGVKPSVRRTSAVSMGSSPYLAVKVYAAVFQSGAQPIIGDPEVKINGVVVNPVAASGISSSRTLYFATGNFATLEATSPYFNSGGSAATIRVSVDKVERTDVLPLTGTTRQQSRTATILGSAPTQAAIRVYDPTPAALGSDVLVYTTRNSFVSPPLRPFLASAASTTSDTGMISGARNPLSAPTVCRIPAASLLDGMYGLVGRLNVTTAGTLGWSVRIVDSTGAATIGSGVTDSGSIEVPVTGGYRAINLAAMLLPPVEVEGTQLVEITITGTANMTWDEFWLFNLTEGSLTWIRDADSMTWIEIRPPELGRLPSIYGGTGAFGTNPVCVDYKTIGADYGAADQHYADPGLIQVFAVTSTSLKAQTDLWFYPRYLDAVIDEAA